MHLVLLAVLLALSLVNAVQFLIANHTEGSLYATGSVLGIMGKSSLPAVVNSIVVSDGDNEGLKTVVTFEPVMLTAKYRSIYHYAVEPKFKQSRYLDIDLAVYDDDKNAFVLRDRLQIALSSGKHLQPTVGFTTPLSVTYVGASIPIYAVSTQDLDEGVKIKFIEMSTTKTSGKPGITRRIKPDYNVTLSSVPQLCANLKVDSEFTGYPFITIKPVYDSIHRIKRNTMEIQLMQSAFDQVASLTLTHGTNISIGRPIELLASSTYPFVINQLLVLDPDNPQVTSVVHFKSPAQLTKTWTSLEPFVLDQQFSNSSRITVIAKYFERDVGGDLKNTFVVKREQSDDFSIVASILDDEDISHMFSDNEPSTPDFVHYDSMDILRTNRRSNEVRFRKMKRVSSKKALNQESAPSSDDGEKEQSALPNFDQFILNAKYGTPHYNTESIVKEYEAPKPCSSFSCHELNSPESDSIVISPIGTNQYQSHSMFDALHLGPSPQAQPVVVVQDVVRGKDTAQNGVQEDSVIQDKSLDPEIVEEPVLLTRQHRAIILANVLKELQEIHDYTYMPYNETDASCSATNVSYTEVEAKKSNDDVNLISFDDLVQNLNQVTVEEHQFEPDSAEECNDKYCEEKEFLLMNDDEQYPDEEEDLEKVENDFDGNSTRNSDMILTIEDGCIFHLDGIDSLDVSPIPKRDSLSFSSSITGSEDMSPFSNEQQRPLLTDDEEDFDIAWLFESITVTTSLSSDDFDLASLFAQDSFAQNEGSRYDSGFIVEQDLSQFIDKAKTEENSDVASQSQESVESEPDEIELFNMAISSLITIDTTHNGIRELPNLCNELLTINKTEDGVGQEFQSPENNGNRLDIESSMVAYGFQLDIACHNPTNYCFNAVRVSIKSDDGEEVNFAIEPPLAIEPGDSKIVHSFVFGSPFAGAKEVSIQLFDLIDSVITNPHIKPVVNNELLHLSCNPSELFIGDSFVVSGTTEGHALAHISSIQIFTDDTTVSEFHFNEGKIVAGAETFIGKFTVDKKFNRHDRIQIRIFHKERQIASPVELRILKPVVKFEFDCNQVELDKPLNLSISGSHAKLVEMVSITVHNYDDSVYLTYPIERQIGDKLSLTMRLKKECCNPKSIYLHIRYRDNMYPEESIKLRRKFTKVELDYSFSEFVDAQFRELEITATPEGSCTATVDEVRVWSTDDSENDAVLLDIHPYLENSSLSNSANKLLCRLDINNEPLSLHEFIIVRAYLHGVQVGSSPVIPLKLFTPGQPDLPQTDDVEYTPSSAEFFAFQIGDGKQHLKPRENVEFTLRCNTAVRSVVAFKSLSIIAVPSNAAIQSVTVLQQSSSNLLVSSENQLYTLKTWTIPRSFRRAGEVKFLLKYSAEVYDKMGNYLKEINETQSIDVTVRGKPLGQRPTPGTSVRPPRAIINTKYQSGKSTPCNNVVRGKEYRRNAKKY